MGEQSSAEMELATTSSPVRQDQRQTAEWRPMLVRAPEIRRARGERVVSWVALVLFGVGFAIDTEFGMATRAFAAFAAILIGTALYAGKDTPPILEGDELADRARGIAESLPGGVPGFAAKVSFRKGGQEYASDVGLILVADGWLVFEGVRTDFSLAPHDCGGFWPRGSDALTTREAEISLAGLEGDVRLFVSAVDWTGSPKSLLSSWINGQVLSSAVSVLPPLKPAAALATPSSPLVRLLIMGSLFGCVVTGLTVLLQAPEFRGHHFLTLIVLVISIAVGSAVLTHLLRRGRR